MKYHPTENSNPTRERTSKAISRACFFGLLAVLLITVGVFLGAVPLVVGCIFALLALWFSLDAVALNRDRIEAKLRAVKKESLRKQVALRRERRDIEIRRFLGSLKAKEDVCTEQDSARKPDEASVPVKKLERFALLCALGVILFD